MCFVPSAYFLASNKQIFIKKICKTLFLHLGARSDHSLASAKLQLLLPPISGSLRARMNAVIKTAQTKVQADTLLLAKSLTSSHGEKVFVLLQVQADEATAKTLQKEYLAIVQHSLLETEGETAKRLDSTLKELNGLVKGLLLSKSISDIHSIIAISQDDGLLHVSHAGRAEAYVVRSGTASQITEYTRGKPSPAFVHIASGQLESGDIIILSTQRLLRTVTPAQLAKLCAGATNVLEDLKASLESEKEQAALASLTLKEDENSKEELMPAKLKKKAGKQESIMAKVMAALPSGKSAKPAAKRGKATKKGGGSWQDKFRTLAEGFHKDIRDPSRKKKAHLLILAALVAVFLVVWAAVNISSFSQSSKTRAELENLIEEINEDIRTAENRRLTGDKDSATAILERAEQRAKQVMDNESGLFRTEALDLLDRIRAKSEEVSNIVRLSPLVVANLAASKPEIQVQGFIGTGDEEFIVYDKQDLYRVVYNNVEDPDRLVDEELILQGTDFERYQTRVFQTTGNGVVELISGQPTAMKTDDPAGWVTGKDILTYLRFLYVLSPENNQIYKYERLSNRYSSPDEYNVNGDLSGALSMTIDGNIYVLKQGGAIVKLLRGETQPFVIRHAPDNVLMNATKIYKVFDGNIYFLDPVKSRVIVITDGGPSGESTYLKQYVLEGENQIGELQDLYVDPDESRLYVMDEKRVYKIDLGPRG